MNRKVCAGPSQQSLKAVKINKSPYIALFGFSGSIKKLSSLDCVNIYLFSILFSIDFARWKNLFSFDCLNIYFFSVFFPNYLCRDSLILSYVTNKEILFRC